MFLLRFLKLPLLLVWTTLLDDQVNGFLLISKIQRTESGSQIAARTRFREPSWFPASWSDDFDFLDPHADSDSQRLTRIITEDPAHVEIEDSACFQDGFSTSTGNSKNKEYPFALMMQGSAPFIAAHADQTAIVHIPGDLFCSDKNDSIISDIALARILGMKIILVVGCRYDTDSCSLDFENAAQCHNSLKVTDAATLRRLEEEAGFIRTEMERKLNKCLRTHGGGSSGNVVSGNFFTAQPFGVVKGEDFEFTGFASAVHTRNIEKVLENNDIVLLTTVGLSRVGDLIHVNGYHLAASVAAALNAYKLIYFAEEGSVFCERDDKGNRKLIQEMPLSFAQAVLRHHSFDVHRAGFATFQKEQSGLESRAVELLLHLGWAAWALEQGVTRCHIVNPLDGAVLEELFTSKNGANTCLYHDDERENAAEAEELDSDDWDHFFLQTAERKRQVAKFG